MQRLRGLHSRRQFLEELDRIVDNYVNQALLAQSLAQSKLKELSIFCWIKHLAADIRQGKIMFRCGWTSKPRLMKR